MNFDPIDVRHLIAIFTLHEEVFASDNPKPTKFLYTMSSCQNSRFIQNRTTTRMLVRCQRWNAPLNRHLVRKFTGHSIATFDDPRIERKGTGQTCCKIIFNKSFLVRYLFDFYALFKQLILTGWKRPKFDNFTLKTIFQSHPR